MADVYCNSCGNSLPAGAQFCSRCGASAGSTAPDADATRTDVYSPYQPTDPGAYGFAAPPAYPVAPPPPPTPSRRASPALLLAIAALAVAVIAVVVVVVVVNTGNRSSTAATGQTSSISSSAISTTSATASGTPSAPTGSPTLTQPKIVTVTRSATLTAAAGDGGGAAEPVPLSTDQLRSVFESGTQVNRSPYERSPNVFFETPSGNIECALFIDGDQVQCAIDRYDFDQPGPDCDNGALFTLDSYGNATYSGCLTSHFFSDANSLRYGASLANGEFGCVSRSVGVSCVDVNTDTGFTLSRQQFVPVN